MLTMQRKMKKQLFAFAVAFMLLVATAASAFAEEGNPLVPDQPRCLYNGDQAMTNQVLSIYGNSVVSDNRETLMWQQDGSPEQLWVYHQSKWGDYRIYSNLKFVSGRGYTLNINNNTNRCTMLYDYEENAADSAVKAVVINGPTLEKLSYITLTLHKNKYNDKDYYLRAMGSRANGTRIEWATYIDKNWGLWC